MVLFTILSMNEILTILQIPNTRLEFTLYLLLGLLLCPINSSLYLSAKD